MFVRVLVAAVLAVTGGLVATSLGAAPASAQHDWKGYHWSTSSYPINLRPVNSFAPGFRKQGVSAAVNKDWNRSVKFANRQRFWNNGLDIRRRCPYVRGSYRMCNHTYGTTGWAGKAQIRLNGKHIIAARVRVNDTYGRSYKYRRHVLCHEVGHALGLWHRRNTSDSCLNPSSAGYVYLGPDSHDYNMLRKKYSHRHTSLAAALESKGTDAIENWAHDPHHDVEVAHLPDGETEITFTLRPPPA